MIVVAVDVGGTKTAVAVMDGDRRIGELTGPGAAVRPGRTMSTASAVADLARQALARSGLIRADALVVGAAGAGRAADAEEVRAALARERITERVVVVSDVMLALAALGTGPGVVLVAGTGSVAVGRSATGALVRQGGYGWQMGDEGGGYWIGQRALRAVGLAHDGRGPSTTLTARLTRATGAADFRDVVAWSTVATPREVAGLATTVLAAADDGDPVATTITTEATAALVLLVERLRPAFGGGTDPVPVGFSGGLLRSGGPFGSAVARGLTVPFSPIPEPIDPLTGAALVLAESVR